jgi:hypothetical protein
VAASSHKFEIALQALAHKISVGGSLKVGFLEGVNYPVGDNSKFLSAVGSKATPKPSASVSVAQVAFWNEFGTKTAPARPFFRNTIAEQSAKWGKGLGKLMIQTKLNGPQSLELLGREMKNDIVTSIQRWPADNAALTVKIKGFNKGLVHNSVMVRNVAYKVES